MEISVELFNFIKNWTEYIIGKEFNKMPLEELSKVTLDYVKEAQLGFNTSEIIIALVYVLLPVQLQMKSMALEGEDFIARMKQIKKTEDLATMIHIALPVGVCPIDGYSLMMDLDQKVIYCDSAKHDFEIPREKYDPKLDLYIQKLSQRVNDLVWFHGSLLEIESQCEEIPAQLSVFTDEIQETLKKLDREMTEKRAERARKYNV
jgi:hypothetical protein